MKMMFVCMVCLVGWASAASSVTLHGTMVISLNTEKMDLPGALPPQQREVWVKGPKIRIEEIRPDDSTHLVIIVYDGLKGYRFSRIRVNNLFPEKTIPGELLRLPPELELDSVYRPEKHAQTAEPVAFTLFGQRGEIRSFSTGEGKELLSAKEWWLTEQQVVVRREVLATAGFATSQMFTQLEFPKDLPDALFTLPEDVTVKETVRPAPALPDGGPVKPPAPRQRPGKGIR